MRGLLGCSCCQGLLKEEAVQTGKQQLLEIVSMLISLITSLMTRLREEPGDYIDFSEQE